MKTELLLLAGLLMLTVTSMSCYADENVNMIEICESQKYGELPVVIEPFKYSEFQINDNNNEDIIFMSDFKPLNLLSNKKPAQTSPNDNSRK